MKKLRDMPKTIDLYLVNILPTLIACMICLLSAAYFGLIGFRSDGAIALLFYFGCIYLTTCSILMPIRMESFTAPMRYNPENFWSIVLLESLMIVFWGGFEFLNWCWEGCRKA